MPPVNVSVNQIVIKEDIRESKDNAYGLCTFSIKDVHFWFKTPLKWEITLVTPYPFI